MYKELIILITIIILILVLESITQNYTKTVIDDLNYRLSELQKEIEENNSDNIKIQNDVNKIYNDLMDYHDKLSLYLEHSELEKVETSIVSSKSFIKSSEYKQAIEELEKTSFLLSHIKDKYALNLSNIF